MKKLFKIFILLFIVYPLSTKAQCPTNASYASSVLTLNFSSFSGCGTLDHILITVSSGTGAGNTYNIPIATCNSTTITTQTTNVVDATSILSVIEYYDSGNGQIGSSCNNSISLPVKFTSFVVEKSGFKNLLKWSTSMEINNMGFFVERNTDPSNPDQFEEIAFIASRSGGNSQSNLNYNFLDNDFLYGDVYYRLKQIDFDCKYEYTDVITINSEFKKLPEKIIFDLTGNMLDELPDSIPYMIYDPLSHIKTIIIK